MSHCLLSLLAGMLLISFAQARDWHSADGRAIAGSFVKLTGDSVVLKSAAGQALSVPLSALTAEDQAFAKAAQTYNVAAVTLGPKSFESRLGIGDGAICYMAKPLGNGSVLFIGEQFYLAGDASAPVKQGQKWKDQPLFFAGNKNLHPIKGEAQSLRCYALSVEVAMSVAAGPADIYEPIVDLVEARGLGYCLGETGLLMVDSALLTHSTSIMVDLGKDLQPGQVVATNQELGITIISIKGALSAAHLAPRKPLALGQAVMAYHFLPGQFARSLLSPVGSQGKITKLTDAAHFEMDAKREPGAMGGLVVSDKGDIIGILKSQALIKRGTSRAAPTVLEEMPAESLSICLRTEALMPYFKNVPKVTATRTITAAEEKDITGTLAKSTVIVRVIRETHRDRTPQGKGAK